MRRQDRLGALKMGVSWDDQVAMPLGGRHHRPLERPEPDINPIERVANPELDVRCHLIVATSGRMELPADIAEAVDKGRLDVHVDVLAIEPELKLPFLNFRPNIRQASHNLLAFFKGDQTYMSKHLSVRDGTPDVVLEETTVKRDRLRKLFDAAIGFFSESPAPRLLGHPLPLR